MRPLIQEISTALAPEQLIQQLHGDLGVILLRSYVPDGSIGIEGVAASQARYSFVAVRPFLTFRSFGSRCEVASHAPLVSHQELFGNPWHLLDSLMARYELLEEVDLPFPLGGCFGYWGYDLKNFVEPKLRRRAINDLELPYSHVGFYDSLVAFDHHLGKVWIVSTGLAVDGSRCETRAWEQLEWWKAKLTATSVETAEQCSIGQDIKVVSNLSPEEFVAKVNRAQAYIRNGDIYQVNLSHRLSADFAGSGRELFERLTAVSPAPFAAFMDCGDFQIASASPEQFLRLSGSHIRTRPIKGTRPRSADPMRDAQLSYELQTSAKEISELVMITDLLRNDLGRVCEYGSVHVPDLARLEKFAHVQHLVSTVEGRLRSDVTHFAAFASCFPGGSITGAPKIRAMEIIDELEPISRGPYTGALGYLGFNRESQLSIIIRTALCKEGRAHFNVGAGIVADSNAEAEYEETIAKARGFLHALVAENRLAAFQVGTVRESS